MWWECWPQAARLFRSEIYNDDKLVPQSSNTHASTYERVYVPSVCACVCDGRCMHVCVCECVFVCMDTYTYVCM